MDKPTDETTQAKVVTDEEAAAEAAALMKVASMTNQELVEYASQGNIWRLGFLNLEMERRLITSLAALDKSTSFWSRWLVALTIVLAVLTLVLVGLTVLLIKH